MSTNALGADKKGILIAIFGSLLLFVLQILAYLNSHFSLVLAGAYDTFSDILISGFLLVSLIWSDKPADEYHMFGHGRVQNVAALVTATIFIFLLALEAIRNSITYSTSPSEYTNINTAIGVTIIAILFYLLPLVIILRNKRKGPAVRAQLLALIEMEIAFVISLIGLLFISRGYYFVDRIVSLIIGLIIAFTGFKLFKENINYLIGYSPSKEFLLKITNTAKSVKGVRGVRDLKAEYVGPDIVHTGFTILVDQGTPIEKADKIAEKVEQRVHETTGCQYCVIHIDPA